MPYTSQFLYITYVLRLWNNYNADSGWRAQLENPHTGERFGFSNPKALIDFLERAGDPIKDLSDSECEM